MKGFDPGSQFNQQDMMDKLFVKMSERLEQKYIHDGKNIKK